jgi:hypothetical protein
VRLLVSEERDSKEALRVLHSTSQRLEDEKQRGDELERRLTEATERWKVINQARIHAESESARLTEELRLYKMQLEASQQQVIRANEVIAQADKEKNAAEDAAEKAKGLVRKLQEEKIARQAREDGIRLGREEGKKEGIKIGLERGREQAYVEAREEAMQRLDDWIDKQGWRREDGGGGGRYAREEVFEDEMDPAEEEEGEDDMYEQQPSAPPPRQRAREMAMMDQQRQRQQQQQQQEQQQLQQQEQLHQQQQLQQQQQQRLQQQSMPPGRSSFGGGARPMPEPQALPGAGAPLTRSATMPPQFPQPFSAQPPPNRSRSGRSFFGRLRTRIAGRPGSTDPNVERNPSDAPDFGIIVDTHTGGGGVTSPLSASITQPGHMRAASPMVPMPEPNHHPDPRDVPPIVQPVTPRTPSHPHVEIPPDGYIPELDANGSIGLPPPHELARPPPTPREGRSPALTSASLPGGGAGQAPPAPTKERDFYYEKDQRQPVAGGSTSRAYPVHGYQRSIADSVNSEATSQLSILTPPNAVKGAMSVGSRLSAIPESQTPSPYQGQQQFGAPPMGQRPLSRASGRSGISGVSGRSGRDRGGYPDEFSENRQRIADELKDPDYNSSRGTPRRGAEQVCFPSTINSYTVLVC